MIHYVAFLRGINLGKRRVKMTMLKTLFDELGFSNVATFIASGNVRFEYKRCDDRKLAEIMERHLEKSLGYEVDTFVRTREEIAAVAAAQPFGKDELANTANTIHVGFLKEALKPVTAQKLLACRTGVDEFYASGREFFWLCRIKSHESKVWSSLEMKATAVPSATMRNLTTIRKLAALSPVL